MSGKNYQIWEQRRRTEGDIAGEPTEDGDEAVAGLFAHQDWAGDGIPGESERTTGGNLGDRGRSRYCLKLSLATMYYHSFCTLTSLE